jgi:alpha-mannosidase
LPRIEIVNEIAQNFSDVLSWKFDFNLKNPDVWHEEVGAVIRARLTPDQGHYSPVHSRLDWLTLNHFAAMSGEDGAGVTLSSADLAFMKLGDSAVKNGVSVLDTATPRISVLAGGQVDGPRLGVPRQGGDSYFLQRFALQPYSTFSAAQSMMFALEHQNPLRAAMVTGGAAYPEETFSLLVRRGADTLLWALKPAEEGIHGGVIARFWNLSGARRQLIVSLAGGVASAARATHIETDLAAAPVKAAALNDTIGPHELRTYRLKGSK